MRVSYTDLKQEFKRVLLSRGVAEATADDCAGMFADTSANGVYSHGVNRFPRFIQQLDAGDIVPDAEPSKLLSLGAIEQWDAHQGIGNLTARRMMDRAMQLADSHGIGLVALRNANHWMRGGGFGWQAAEKGYIGICWTNSIAVMATLGRQGVPDRHQPADRRGAGQPHHHGGYVDVDVLLWCFGAKSAGGQNAAGGRRFRQRRTIDARSCHH
jgi:LDH2 family malate/lactate/ureidoglycolate dehydrogenase